MTSASQIERDIERTRTELSDDVNALTYKVSPNRMVGERVDRVKGAVRNAKARVMGTSTDMRERTGATARSAAATMGETVKEAPERVRQRTEGSPLAAGLVAFGLGMIASALVSPTEAERELTGKLKERAGGRAEGLKEEMTHAAQQAKEHLREPAQQAVQQVKGTAAQSAGTVQEEGRAAGQGLRDQMREAGQNR